MIKRFCMLFACLCLAPLAAVAADNLQWRCWYDQQIHITCLLDEAPEAAPAMAPALPSNIPAMVAALRKDPGAFRNRLVHVPLHTQPLDMEFTALLARSAVCGSRSDCSVNFTAQLPPTEEIVALLNKNLPYLQRSSPTALAMADLDD